MWILCTLFLALFVFEKGLARIPDFIHPCTADNNTCILQSTIDALPEFTKGLPDMGVPTLDPFTIEKLSLPLPGLKASLYNGKMTGFRKLVIDNVESNFKKHKFMMEFHGNLSLKGSYKARGRILVMPIDGEGDLKVKLTNFKMKVTINTAVVPDDEGRKHFHAKGYQYTIEYGQASFNLTNLFKGNPELSNTVLTFINENWRLIADEFGKPIIDFATETVVRSIEKFFLAVPIEELVEGPVPSYD
ncbi:circadian clock-controlled protein daywake-like isoform X1 [Cydia pomonella]|uniref:circadian clock-controlled protein daywake-like isoform X1 n=2 Tax=Cydia pomonella TaxID=82600 RepID=UPI002ADE4EE8|nr:circadian clock-controlled protein daywake-like isoform X1 [Cydia pomonella]